MAKPVRTVAAIKLVMALLYACVVWVAFRGGFTLDLRLFELKMHDARPALVAIPLLYVLMRLWTGPGFAGARRALRRARLALALGVSVVLVFLGAWAWKVRAGRVEPDFVPAAVSFPTEGDPHPAPFARSAPAGRVVLLGIDGATLDIIEPLAAAGKLPNLKALMDAGTTGVLYSVRSHRPWTDETGIWSPAVWTSIATGKLPFRHGILDFRLPAAGNPAKLEMVSSYHRRCKALWNMTTDLGIRSGTVGWWATWPAESVNGVMVSSHVGLRGFQDGAVSAAAANRAPGLTFPEDFNDRIRSRVPLPSDVDGIVRDRFFDLDRCRIRPDGDRATFRSVCFQDLYFGDIGKIVLDDVKPDFFALYLEGIDVASHLFLEFAHGKRVSEPGCDPMRLASVVPHYYALVDEIVGRVLEAAGPDATVMVVSDHGFGLDPRNMYGADHEMEGVFILKGPGVRRHTRLRWSPLLRKLELRRDAPRVLDVAPTVLYLLGAPMARDFDGRVMVEAFENDYLRAHPVTTIPTYEGASEPGDAASPVTPGHAPPPEIEKEYQERLKSLQYVR